MRATSKRYAGISAGFVASLVLLATPVLAEDGTRTASERLEAAMASKLTKGQQAIEELALLAADSDPWVRRTAILALGERSGPTAEREAAAQGLVGPLKSSDAETRELAAIAAGRLGAKELAVHLGGLVTDENDRVAYHAIGGLEILGDSESLGVLAKALGRDNEGLRHRALISIAALAEATSPIDPRSLAEAAAGVAELARDDSLSRRLRQHAILTLGSIRDPMSVLTLVALANSADPAIAGQASDTIRRVRRVDGTGEEAP